MRETRLFLTLKNNMISFRIGFFLAIRQIQRSTKWSTILIILVMLLTFLNLVVVSGVLVGLIEGAVSANRERNTSDLIISTLREKTYIPNSTGTINIAENLPYTKALSARYIQGGTIQSNFKESIRDDELPEEVSTSIIGINPVAENEVTQIGDYMIEGEFLEPDDFDQVVIGYLLLQRYLNLDSSIFASLDDVYVGSKVRIRIGDISREMTVKGIVKTKVDEIDRSVYLNDFQLRSMIGRDDFNVDQIVLDLGGSENANKAKEALLKNGIGEFAKVQTFEDAQPKFLKDIKDTFSLLGTMIGSIGLVVAAITIFIVIFVNAITRRRQIGIMKAIGINSKAIELSYVFQSLFYAVIGSGLGLIIVYFLLVPYFASNPINFPFSDGILVAPAFGTSIRLILLVIVTAIAGYLPARIIVKKNTLDSILGRK